MTNGVSVSVIAALLVGPVAPMKLPARVSPHFMWVFRMDFPKAITPVAYQIQIPESDRQKLHSACTCEREPYDCESFGGVKKL